MAGFESRITKQGRSPTTESVVETRSPKREPLSAEKIQDITERGIRAFLETPIGEEVKIPVTSLRPSQPDDGLDPARIGGAIEVAAIDEEPIVIHGNHRYHRRCELIQPHSIPRIIARRVANPYEQ